MDAHTGVVGVLAVAAGLLFGADVRRLDPLEPGRLEWLQRVRRHRPDNHRLVKRGLERTGLRRVAGHFILLRLLRRLLL